MSLGRRCRTPSQVLTSLYQDCPGFLVIHIGDEWNLGFVFGLTVCGRQIRSCNFLDGELARARQQLLHTCRQFVRQRPDGNRAKRG